MLVFQVVVLFVTFADIPALEQLGLRFGGTAAAYLALYLVFRYLFRIADEDEPRRIMRGQE
jgi:hypothetical protein